MRNIYNRAASPGIEKQGQEYADRTVKIKMAGLDTDRATHQLVKRMTKNPALRAEFQQRLQDAFTKPTNGLKAS